MPTTPARNPENTFDAVWVSNDNLNVCLLIKSGAWINRLAFDEDASERVHRGQVLVFKDTVEAADYRAIEISPKPVRVVLRQRNAGHRRATHQTVIRDLYPLDTRGSCQVLAQAEFYDGPDHKWFGDGGRFPFGTLASEGNGALGIGFPKVDSWTKPIVLVVAGPKLVAS